MESPEPIWTDAQRRYVQALAERHKRRTARSRAIARRYQERVADPRPAIAWRPETAEMSYPLVARRSEGARIWDIDGNSYIDISMGFGTHLFGHNPSFLVEALRAQLERGIHLGPRSPLLGEVAERICRLTGMERVVLCNSGTHAVVTATRLARARTRRSTIALFRASYHGHAIETLAYAPRSARAERPAPLGPGIPQSAADDVLVLDYGDDRAWAVLDARTRDLAAILVEPVQTRQPGLFPVRFLHELRRWTEVHQVALIFDEVVTGFRVHPRGVQGLLGITADLATYGKLLGGGLPIGVVAGRAAYLDGIDGGMWRGAGRDAPVGERVVFGGTFNSNPLTLAAALAVLEQLEGRSPGLQEELGRMAANLATELNRHFEQHRMPIELVHFASMFRFLPPGGHALFLPLEIELLCYQLAERGFYIWEGRLCFLSAAHTQQNLRDLIRAVVECTGELQHVGFLTPRPPVAPIRPGFT